MSMILVTPLSAVAETIRRDRPSHLVTLLSPEHMIETPAGLLPDHHLRLGMNDVPDAQFAEAPPAANHIGDLINFGRTWDAQAPMLVHCWAGVSRSMAAAYILLCDRLGPGSEADIAKAIRFRAPHAYPNPLLVKLADVALGREGRMIAAAAAMGRGTIVTQGERVEFPLRLEDL
ncbi:MAG TPA: protein-tyrosine phosphatase family protein [Rhizomicrobium sp.]|nr:protein-tyrosine phosphatase family protein [Rhizomicrobium sp.]